MTVDPEAAQALIDQHRIEQFLYHEARLIDERRFEDWEALWEDDAIYWVPANGDGTNPDRQVSLIYDSRSRLHTRVERFAGGLAHSQEPPPRTTRVIGNVEIEPGEQGWVVHAALHLTESRPGVLTTWAGRTTHDLHERDGQLRITRKVVTLVNNDQELTALDFLL